MITIFGKELKLKKDTQITYFHKSFKYPSNKNVELTGFLDLPKCTMRALNILDEYFFLENRKNHPKFFIDNIKDVETIIEFGEWVNFFMMKKVNIMTSISIQDYLLIHPDLSSDIVGFIVKTEY